jgi:hypothetical protein
MDDLLLNDFSPLRIYRSLDVHRVKRREYATVRSRFGRSSKSKNHKVPPKISLQTCCNTEHMIKSVFKTDNLLPTSLAAYAHRSS